LGFRYDCEQAASASPNHHTRKEIICSAAVNEFRLIPHYIEEKVQGQRKIVSFIVHGKKSDIECFQLRLVILKEKNWDVSRLR